jgi:hypothetical protein
VYCTDTEMSNTLLKFDTEIPPTEEQGERYHCHWSNETSAIVEL